MKKAFFMGLAVAAMMTSQVMAEGISISVDTKKITFEEDAATPYIDDGVTFVPLRGVLDKMGYKNIAWDAENRQAILEMPLGNDSSNLIVVSSDSSVAEVNGLEVDMGVAPQNVNGSLMIPLRAVAELAEGEIEWDAETKSISITTKAAIEKAAAEREKEAASLKKQEEEKAKQDDKEAQALQEAKDKAEAARINAIEEQNFDYSAYPNAILNLTEVLDAQIDDTYKKAERYYVSNATYIKKYANDLTELINENKTKIGEMTVKDSQTEIQALYNEYIAAAEKISSIITKASTSNFDGGSVSRSTKKGERTLGSTSQYQKFKNEYTAASKEIAAAEEALKTACNKYIRSLSE